MNNDKQPTPLQRTAQGLRALTAPQRLRILTVIRRWQPISAVDIAKRLTPEAPASSVSTHLGILVKQGFVKATRAGLTVTYSIDDAGFRAVEEFVRSLSDK